MNKADQILVCGGSGLVGSALAEHLKVAGFVGIACPSRRDLDLRDQKSVMTWFEVHQPSHVFLVAGTVGGIMANATRPADFLYDNLAIHSNVIEAARKTKVAKLLYLGSSCIYPRDCEQPIVESALLTGPLEQTNEWYALAKIAGVKMCQAYRRQYGCDFIAGMPTNLYGPNDNFSTTSGHVLPALIRRFHEAKVTESPSVVLWGSGEPLREFLHVDDLASACLFLMQNYSEDVHINIGSGQEVRIRELAEVVRDVVYPECELIFDRGKPDGTPRKLLDSRRINELGWQAEIGLRRGIEATYAWVLNQLETGRHPRGWNE